MKRSEPAQRGSGQSDTDPGLLARPLDFISEDHLRERQICAEIDSLVATVAFNRGAGATILRFLNEELGAHHIHHAVGFADILENQPCHGSLPCRRRYRRRSNISLKKRSASTS